MFAQLLILLLPTLTLANPPTTPNNHILQRQSSSCEDISAKTCPGGKRCCPMLWDCKANDANFCTASIDANYILTISAINWESAVESASRDAEGIKSRLSVEIASITGGSGSVQTNTALSSASVSDGEQASSASQAVGSVTSTPTAASRLSTASLAAATVSATGAAALSTPQKNLAIGGLVGVGMLLL